MTQTHPPWTDSPGSQPQTAVSRTVEDADREADPPVGRDQKQRSGHSGRSETFDATVDGIARRLGSNSFNPLAHLEDLMRRRLGLAPRSLTAGMLAGLSGIGIRLAVVLLVTAIAGQDDAVPWGRWAVILLFYGLLDASQPFRTPLLDVPVGPRVARWMDDYMALLRTIERESDLNDVAGFVRRWVRLPVATTVGIAVASIMLLVCWLLAPSGMSELPAGSVVLLTLLLFDFAAACVTPSDLAMWIREARYDHRLFWPSPVDSPEVQRAMRMATFFGGATGMWITMYVVLAVVLVSWDSPLVVPLSVGFLMIGYLWTFACAAVVRSAIQTIVKRSRDRRLERLRRRIEAFDDRFDDLSAEESAQVSRLIDLHNTIRNAPTTLTASRTLARNVAGLIPATIVFIVTVFGEVSAERVLDAILP